MWVEHLLAAAAPMLAVVLVAMSKRRWVAAGRTIPPAILIALLLEAVSLVPGEVRRTAATNLLLALAEVRVLAGLFALLGAIWLWGELVDLGRDELADRRASEVQLEITQHWGGLGGGGGGWRVSANRATLRGLAMFLGAVTLSGIALALLLHGDSVKESEEVKERSGSTAPLDAGAATDAAADHAAQHDVRVRAMSSKLMADGSLDFGSEGAA